jgi:hypothetical protein
MLVVGKWAIKVVGAQTAAVLVGIERCDDLGIRETGTLTYQTAINDAIEAAQKHPGGANFSSVFSVTQEEWNELSGQIQPGDTGPTHWV